jgi:hypothetical protein
VIRTALSPALLINLRSLHLQALLWVESFSVLDGAQSAFVNNALHPSSVQEEDDDDDDKPLFHDQ